MAPSSRITLFSPLRVWLVFNVLFVALIASSYYTYYRLAAADNQKMVVSQERLLTRTRFDALKNRRFREFVESAGREFGNLYVKVVFSDEEFVFGRRSRRGHCSSSAHPLMGVNDAGQVRVTICRPFRIAVFPMVGVLLVYVLISGLSLMIVRRLDRRTTSTLAGFLKDSGVEVDPSRGLIGIMAEIKSIGRRLKRAKARERLLVDSKARAEIAEQVAHDIRAPIAALKYTADRIQGLPEKTRLVIRASVSRISGIANDLFAKYRRSPQAEEPRSVCLLPELIESVVEEKRLQYGSRNNVELRWQPDSAARSLFAKMPPAEFKRVLSNLISNGVEALGGPGSVAVGISSQGERISVEVQDDGRGIPAEVLGGLGQRGESHGKADGSGLGLYHAKTSVERWGGKLEIQSKEGRGTTVTIDLPRAQAPEPPVCSSEGGPDAVLVDDDPLTRMTWETAAKARGLDLRVFKNAAELLAVVDSYPRGTSLYLDSHLDNGKRGEEVARELHAKGFSNLYLATGSLQEGLSETPWIKAVVGKEPPWA